MPPRKTRAQCQICKEKESKYTCPGSGCLIDYCSVSCYKQHKGRIQKYSIKTTDGLLVKETTHDGSKPAETPDVNAGKHAKSLSEGDEIMEEISLRPLTSLKWPYVPDESAYPDPLKRDDPKPLQTAQYEAIATSSAIRTILREHPKLKDTLRTIDGLRGSAREEAVQTSLGISMRGGDSDDDANGMGKLAEAIECSVRRGNRDGLGLDWSPERE